MRTTLAGPLVLVLGCAAASPAAAHDEKALKATYDKFVKSLDAAQVAKDYSKAIRNLKADDPKLQIIGLATLTATEEPEVIPWVVPLLDSPHSSVRIHAGIAMWRLVEANALRRRDPAIGHAVVLKPLGPKDRDLRPLAWVVLHILKKPDDGNTHAYAASMIRYLELKNFDADLRNLLGSRHPAVSNAASAALEALGLPVKAAQDK
jgi:hypothetical protein